MHLQDFMPVIQVTIPFLTVMLITFFIQRSDIKDINKELGKIREELASIRERITRLEEKSRLVKL